MSARFPKGDRTGPYIGWGSLNGNRHGPRIEGPPGSYDRETLRSTMQVVFLNNGMMPPPRFFWGVRLWIYAPSGRCWNLDLCWRSAKRYAASDAERAARGKAYVEQQKARGEWPPKHPMGLDYLGEMYAAAGLGLVERQPEQQA